MRAHLPVGYLQRPQRLLQHPRLELQAAVSHPMWVLGHELRSFGRTWNILSTETSLQPPNYTLNHFLFRSIYLMYIHVMLAGMCVHQACNWGLRRSQEGVRFAGTGVTNGCGCWEPNPGPMQGQVLLTMEPSPQCPSLPPEFTDEPTDHILSLIITAL